MAFHLVSRGNNRDPIFRDDNDKQLFLRTLRTIVRENQWQCAAYCLMNNHYHLVIKTMACTLSAGMHQLNGSYARHFNRRHGRSGHVFQGRYRYIVIESEAHFLEACRYVVLNPVRAKLCTSPRDWRWSSYRCTIRPRPESQLAGDVVLNLFADQPEEAVGRYVKFVDEAITKGSEGKIEIENPSQTPALPEVFATDQYPVAIANHMYGYMLSDIGEYLHCHKSTVSRRLQRETKAMEEHTPWIAYALRARKQLENAFEPLS